MDAGITGHSLWFTGPRLVEIREAGVPTPGPRQVVVQTTISAISAGTEMLVYRGQAPADLSADSNLPSLAGTLGFPLRYGYATVGRVIAAGSGVSDRRIGEAVFAFQSHATHFLAAAHDVLPIPPTISAERAAFLPNVETAVNLLLDGVPRVGEQVAVLGQGVVGLLVTALLARIPLASLVTVDRYPTRRQASLALGARACLDASQADLAAALVRHLQADRSYSGADLTFELSGDPSTLDLAIAATGQAGRVVLGSWYGTKRAAPDLGGRFHRSRIRLISSQVSTLPSELGAAWTTTRRLQFALSLLPTLPLETLVSHRIDFHRAHDAYRMLDERPAEALQVLLTYGSNG